MVSSNLPTSETPKNLYKKMKKTSWEDSSELNLLTKTKNNSIEMTEISIEMIDTPIETTEITIEMTDNSIDMTEMPTETIDLSNFFF